ncbi:hypothetical protein YTPLAS18_34430 [Nitrospira sp.]|nr:hypothetical protein YTPLAS18_34430 [Nitrospira sp.]
MHLSWLSIPSLSLWSLTVLVPIGLPSSDAQEQEMEITPDAPIEQFQNRPEDQHPYDFNAPPQGMFLSIQLAENYEEELGFRRTHEIVPVNPTEHFGPESPAVYIVFQLHQHYQAFKVFGLCYLDADPEAIPAPVSRDAMYITMEDESGYLRLPAPNGGWKPGRYKVEIHVGEQISELSLMGTMRFTIAGSPSVSHAAPPL